MSGIFDNWWLRRSNIMLGLLIIGGVGFILMLVHAGFGPRADGLAARKALVKSLGLTDLALFTEARYTRHPSQADLHSPFQDHPLSFDHFPSGSLIGPRRQFQPATLYGQADGKEKQ